MCKNEDPKQPKKRNDSNVLLLGIMGDDWFEKGFFFLSPIKELVFYF